jgi:metallo-beta-lactamase class B
MLSYNRESVPSVHLIIGNGSSNKSMRDLVLFIIAVLIQLNGFAQTTNNKIIISKDIELIRLSENAYIHVSYSDIEGYGRVSSNGLIFINGSDAFLFDTPMTESLTEELVSWLGKSMKLKISGFVPNHWHSDCIGGFGYLKTQNIESYANQMTIDIARSKGLPVPATGFKDSLQLQLGDKLIQCYYPGPAHSMDNIVVWIPSEKILFAGCMVKSLDSKNLGNVVDGDLAAYPNTIENLIKKYPDAKIVIPGHGQPGGIDLIIHTQELLKASK